MLHGEEKERIIMKNKVIAAILGMSLIVGMMGMTVMADPAPDGKTVASETAAAADGAWEAWQSEWETKKTDWMERAKIVALENAPPLMTFNIPKMVFCIVSK